MKITIPDSLIRIIVLDISGVYAKIHDEATLPLSEAGDYMALYSDTSKYRIVKIS